jgi:carbon starvation protein
MNILLLLLLTIPLFWAAYYVYAGFIAKALGLDDKRKTPSELYKDNVDYIPTHPAVLFGHHFAAIAGAGPIVGPTVALLYGYIPVWLWIIFGVIFFGAVHDFTALFVSVREGGKSMAEVAGRTLGRSGFILFICFTIVMIVLVTSAFLGLTSKALTSLAPLTTLNLTTEQTLLHTVTENGVVKAKIGGIASTSVIFITLLSPFIGYLLYRRHMNVWLVSALATIFSLFSIYMGFLYPITFDPQAWMLLLAVYVFFAAGIPVWLLLQPRDFTNAHILYVGVAALLAGIIAAGLKGMTFAHPALNLQFASGHSALGPIWPVLFITVACGAISGFHALVAGGTSSKQLKNEKDAKLVAFGAMLLEAVMAVCVVITVGAGLSFPEYLRIVFPEQLANSNPILAFSLATGNLLHFGLGLPPVFGTILGILLIEGFVITSLDCAVRLNRYLFEELWGVMFKDPPAWLKSYYFNSGLSVALMLLLASTNAYIVIWPIFGTANQLLAALTLIAVSAWLMIRGRNFWFTILPALFMLITTLASLFLLLFTKYLPTSNWPLIVADLLLLVLSFGLAAQASQLFIRRPKKEIEDGRLEHSEEESRLADEMHIG